MLRIVGLSGKVLMCSACRPVKVCFYIDLHELAMLSAVTLLLELALTYIMQEYYTLNYNSLCICLLFVFHVIALMS